MTDRELLELAAKAAEVGIDKSNYCEEFGFAVIGPRQIWNPLKFDGDALRLAVKLNIEFACFDDAEQTNAGVRTPDSKPFNCMTSYDGDKYASVRRAIVRAAADIGRNMK